MKNSLIGFVLAASIIPTVMAQGVTDLASDQELRAGYCLGALQTVRASIDKSAGESGIIDPDQTVDNEINRVREFLLARGLKPDNLSRFAALSGVMIAIKRGAADGTICGRRIDVCVSKCSPYTHACMMECGAEEPACERERQCGRLQLPF